MSEWFSFLAILALSAVCLGQNESATLSGRVTDPGGSAVVGAEVVLTNVETNVESRTKTNGAGLYVFTGVHPGKYRVAAGATGFRVLIKEGLVLHVQDELAENFALTLGTVSETVTVTADAVPMNTTDASVSTVVDRNFAENLPMNGRSFQTLIELTPGVVVVPSNPEDGGQFSINGQRAASNYWTVDGVSANVGISSASPGNGLGGSLGSFSALGGTNSLVSVDAMQEFRIQTSTFAPEFGRTPGGQISIVTRSGTNQFHGTAFDYLRNDLFDASDWFNGYTNNPPLPKAKERQNDFGGTFSGPILKDSTFFFFSYEGLRLRLPQTLLTTVPDLSARQSATPAMQPFLNAYPFDPKQPDLGNGNAQFNATFSDPASLDAYSLRVDHRLRNNISLFARYDYSPSEIVQRGSSDLALSVVPKNQITTQTATVGGTWFISAASTNDLRLNYSRVAGSSSYTFDQFGGAVPLTNLPFPTGVTADNSRFVFLAFPLTGTGKSLQVGHQAENIQRQINLVDSVSVQKGSHNLKFGVDYRRLSPSVIPTRYEQLALFTSLSSLETGSNALGSVTSNADVNLLFHNLGAFLQDTWHATPRLTLTYGVRWDVDFAPSSSKGPSIPSVTDYDLTNPSNLAIAPAGTPPFTTPYGNIAPRLGLAYQISQSQSWQTVLRGGGGVFFDLASSEMGTAISSSSPPFSAFNSFSDNFPFPVCQTGCETAPPTIPSSGTLSNLSAFNPHLKLPYTLQWNVALEQALGQDQTVTATYVGSAGRRLLQASTLVFPPANPNVGFATFVDNLATSDYHALQVQFQRRLSRGLQAIASYTWSHSIDEGSAGSAFNFSNTGVPGNPGANRADSDFDIRHSFSAALTYDIPDPKINALSDAILRGWSLENVVFARSAPPVDVEDQIFVGSALANAASADVRPDLIPGTPLYLTGSQYPGGKAFNPDAFTDPPFDPNTFLPLRQGTTPRNFLRGFGATQWDFAVHRDFPIRESVKLQFRAEMFNLLNHPNFAAPSGAFLSPSFGGPGGFGLTTQLLGQGLSNNNLGSGGLSPLYQIGGPRSMQFALKLQF
jgi:hypothetical protein